MKRSITSAFAYYQTQHAYHRVFLFLQDSLDTIKRRIQAIGRELEHVNEVEFRRLSLGEQASASGATTLAPALPGDVLRDLGDQILTAKQNIVPLKLKPLPKQAINPEGTGAEIMLQGEHIF